jgi:hypothetical protein
MYGKCCRAVVDVSGKDGGKRKANWGLSRSCVRLVQNIPQHFILYKTACRNRRCPVRPLPRYPGEVGPRLPIKPLRFNSYLSAKHQSPILHTAKSTTACLYTGERMKTASGLAVTTSGSIAQNIRIICWCCRENIYLLTYLLTSSSHLELLCAFLPVG